MKTENLLVQNYVKTLICITDKGELFELESINIYNDDGIIYTNRGYFEPLNRRQENEIIKNGIFRRLKKDFSRKENFVVREENSNFSWSDLKRYNLYIYYKNIDFELISLELNNYWLESKIKIFNKYEISQTIGRRNKKSDAIKFDNKVDQLKKELNSYCLFDNEERFKNNIKELKKIFNKYKKQKELENNYTIEDAENCLFDTEIAKEIYFNIKKMIEKGEE